LGFPFVGHFALAPRFIWLEDLFCEWAVRLVVGPEFLAKGSDLKQTQKHLDLSIFYLLLIVCN